MASKKTIALQWNIENRNLKDIRENERNPRRINKHQAAHLQQSIQNFGLCEPLIVNTDGVLIGGHQRLRTLRKLGHKSAPVNVPSRELSQEEVDELCIRLNKNSGEFDIDILANLYDPYKLVEYGFTQEELHLEQIPCDDPSGEGKPSQNATLTISFKDVNHLQEAENRISAIVDEFPGASYKVKVKP